MTAPPSGFPNFILFFILKRYVFIYDGAGLTAVHWLSLVVASGGCSPVVVSGLLKAVASLVVEHGR